MLTREQIDREIRIWSSPRSGREGVVSRSMMLELYRLALAGMEAGALRERAEKAEDERDEALQRRTRAERVVEAVLSLEGDEEPRDLRSRAASAERYGYDSYGALLRAIADALKEADDAE